MLTSFVNFVSEFDDIFQAHWNINDFLIQKEPLGKGRFGDVYKVKEKRTENVFAVKVLCVNTEDEEQKTTIRREIRNQTCVTHPNIVKLYGIFSGNERFFLLMEYVINGDLWKRAKESPNGRLEEKFVSKCTNQLIDALSLLHSKNIFHRDVKPENVLLDENDNVKLTDFGWSIASRTKRNTFCGTLDYLSPELVKSIPHDHHVDIWSLGVLVYDVLAGSAPFARKTFKKTYEAIENVDYKTPDFFSDNVKNFLKLIFVSDMKQRAELHDLKHHPFLNQ